MRDDFDLSWRARIAGYKTVVDPGAVVRHASAVQRELRDSPVRGRTRYFYERNMIATLIKNYSLPRLAIADQVGKVDHLRRHRVADREVAPREQLPEVEPVRHDPHPTRG